MNNLIVISGASGMSGNETVRQLLKDGDNIIGFDNFFASSLDSLKDCLPSKFFSFFPYDVCNVDQMAEIEKAIEKWRSTNNGNIYFINYAAVVHTKHFYEPESTFNTNVLGMRKFLEMAIRQKAHAFINCSTSEVYSMSSYKPNGVTESDPLLLVTAETSQRTSYATGKLLTEYFMRDAVIKTNILGCSIRFANVYSNDELLPEHIIPYTISSLLTTRKVKLLTNAKNTTRSFLHNFDSCAAVIALMRTDAALDGSVYNVGTEEEIEIVDLVKMIGKKMKIHEVDISFEGERTADPPRRLLNTKKIRKMTGWEPKISLDTGLDMCIDFQVGRSAAFK